MDRFKKLLAAATLLVLPVIAACGEDVMVPPPTGSIVGQVSIDGMGADGVTVSLSNGATTATAGGGNYRFETVEQGSYTVTISGFPADVSFDATSAPANIGDTGGTVTVDFRGDYIRTASIMGTVTVENMGLGGVTVRLSGMTDATYTTMDDGAFAFTGLRAGTYSVEISGFDTEQVSFSSTSSAATLDVGETKIIPSFDGTYVRTSSIMGQVSADEQGIPGVTVTVMGQGEDIDPVTTDAGGLYSFANLRSGSYTVAISGYDTDDYEFETTSKTVTVGPGDPANVPFEGTLLRTAGIAGRVSLDDGMGLDGVTVTLAGAAESTTETSGGGQYSFAGLAAGTYVLSIENPNETAYSFAEDEMQKTVMLEDDRSEIVNFSGTHTRTASVSGMLFIDEVVQDKMYTDGEPTITEALAPWLASLADDDPARMAVAAVLAKAKVKLRGPDLNEEQDIAIDPLTGAFSTGESLMAGSYQVELPVNDDDVAAGLEAAGVEFVGESTVIRVDPGESKMVNFPFRITMQTVATGARMGGGGHFGMPVEGVKLALYARADGTVMLDETETDEMGRATFNFARADNTGPAGNDNIVFVKVMEPGHGALVVSGNEYVEINHASTARLYAADHEKEVATLVNIAVAFDFWVKSNETARDGNEFLGGWNTQVYMGDPEADDAMPLMMEDEDGEMVNATLPTDTTTGDNLGKSTFAYVVDPTMLGEDGVTFTVMATPVEVAEDGARTSVQPDMGEMWEQGDALTFTHTGLELPPGEDDMPTDLGPLRITYTTQAVYVGAHREMDDRTGFTDFFGVGGLGDDRPMGSAVGEIEVSLMVADSRGRLRAFEYDHDFDDETDDVEATKTVGSTGMVSFAHIPADTEFTVVAKAGSGMTIVPDYRSSTEIDAFGDQLDDYPDGKMAGAFGDGSGARPDVWICPLWRQDNEDPNENCSTFAYKWATGTISGMIDGLRTGDKATVTLTPVNSNDEYADDLADDAEVTKSAGVSAMYSFTGVADGRYMVTLAANPGSWEEDKVTGLEIVHDEDSDDEDYIGATDTGNLSATDLRGVIRGRIANDSNGRSGLTSDESRAGVMVELYTAKKVSGSGATKDNYVPDERVTDGDDDPVTAETDGDGVYMFENLVVEDMYFVKPVGTDLYTAVRNGNTSIGTTAEMADDVVPHALVAAGLPPKAGSEPGIPTWDYHTSTATAGGDANFVLLYKDGEVEGEVSDPSVRAAHSRVVVELRQCKTTNYVAPTDLNDPATGTALSQCTAYTDVEAEATVDAKGNWSAEGLMEGIYEVTPDLPAGYVSVNKSGGEASDADPNATPAVPESFFSQQMVELMGGRADDDTETFHIKDRNAGDDILIKSVTIDGDACGIAAAAADPTATWTVPTDRCGDNANDDGTIAVKVTASTGATIRLSSSDSEATPSGTGTYSHAVTNGTATNVSLPKGLRQFHIHVAAGDGYTKNDPATTSANFEARRDADVRMNSLTVTWVGGTLELDRDALDLDTDGEDAPVTGAVDLGTITLTGAPATATAINVSAAAIDAAFGNVTVATAACTTREAPTTASTTPTAVTLTDHDTNADTPEQETICISIGDWKSTEDSHSDNGHQYQAIVRLPAS